MLISFPAHRKTPWHVFCQRRWWCAARAFGAHGETVRTSGGAGSGGGDDGGSTNGVAAG